jgi:antibiotic biosynthesis monooxygenase (ABM) superfamily enzyme
LDDETPVSSVVAALRIRADATAAFFSWQARMSTAAAAMPGFLSIEFIPVSGPFCEWHMVLQFRDAPSLAGWRASQRRDRLHQEVQACLDHASELNETAAPDLHAQGSVTEVVTTRVKPQMKTAFLDWSARIQQAQAAYPGYRGTYLQAPSRQQEFWTTLIRFATPGELDAWLASPERRRLVAESEPVVAAWSSRRLSQPFAGWFPAQETIPTPPIWKQSMVVLLVLFPIVMLELRFLGPLTRGLNSVVATFVGNLISVGLLTWPVMPLANRALDWWLRPAGRPARWITPSGTVFLAALYVAEISIFKWLI